MDLCTVISERFIPQALNLIQSYKINSFDQKVYLYYFNTNRTALDVFTKLFGDQVILIEVEKTCAHALEPRVFFYKVYAIRDCLTNYSSGMMYSDSANCLIQETDTLVNDLVDGSLFLSYNHPRLTNQYWTTSACFKAMDCAGAEIMPQYWAGFQAYQRTEENLHFVDEWYEYMKDPVVALPDTTLSFPDGQKAPCIEHRQDQSAFSLLIHKHNRHQFLDLQKNAKYGDWQTIVEFEGSYKPDFSKMVLSPRESKFNQFRFLSLK